MLITLCCAQLLPYPLAFVTTHGTRVKKNQKLVYIFKEKIEGMTLNSSLDRVLQLEGYFWTEMHTCAFFWVWSHNWMLPASSH